MIYNVERFVYADGLTEYRVHSKDILSGSDLPPRKKSKSKGIETPWHTFARPWVQTYSDPKRSKRESIRRAVDKVELLGRANKWDYFFTLTLSPEYMPENSYEAASRLMQKWLDCFRKQFPNEEHLIVLEPGGKKGRWHAHGLVRGCKLPLINSGHKTRDHQTIYNLPVENYKYGHTTVTYIRSTGACARYVSKYIKKDLGCIPTGKKRYWASRSLKSRDDIRTVYLFDRTRLDGSESDWDILFQQLQESCDRMHTVDITLDKPCSVRRTDHKSRYGDAEYAMVVPESRRLLKQITYFFMDDPAWAGVAPT